MSILSFPNRGKWGNSQYRGNCSGHVYKELFETLQPRTFVDTMMGSGTSIEVAQEMGIQAWGLDLHAGFNALKDSILERVGQETDLVMSHPPYGGMIKYSGPGGMWGVQAHPDDLSHCIDDEDFHQKMQRVMLNQREATRAGGFYGTIIGDWRRQGLYTSYQAEIIARLPADELAGVLIKAQHNCVSDKKSYGSMKLPRIYHEYILLWQKKQKTMLVLLRDIGSQDTARNSGTWRNIVDQALRSLGGQAELAALYETISQSASDKMAQNPNWKAKVRQTLQIHPAFEPADRGVWRVAA